MKILPKKRVNKKKILLRLRLRDLGKKPGKRSNKLEQLVKQQEPKEKRSNRKKQPLKQLKKQQSKRKKTILRKLKMID